MFPALVAHERVLDLSARDEVGRPRGTLELLDRWDEVLPALEALAASTGRSDWRALAGLHVHSPVEPRQVFQAGANYRTHVIDIAAAHHDGSDGRAVEQVRADAAAQMDDRLKFPPYVSPECPARSAGRTTTSSSRTTGRSRIGSWNRRR
ncbi:hypothetical protein [Actinomadura napierensis]|uniref:Fumarylacetoacetase-like C-terminal domain-containing protein n=1 Tax=Actinomadura napierensis TaxID=267854 RepID=A0ABN2YQI1_9ACTN